jgi:hypothetical protein
VNVDAPVLGEIEHLSWKDLTERNHHPNIEGAEGLKRGAKRGELLSQRGWLEDRDSVLEGELFDRGHRDLAATSRWSVWLGEDRSNRDAGGID